MESRGYTSLHKFIYCSNNTFSLTKHPRNFNNKASRRSIAPVFEQNQASSHQRIIARKATLTSVTSPVIVVRGSIYAETIVSRPPNDRSATVSRDASRGISSIRQGTWGFHNYSPGGV